MSERPVLLRVEREEPLAWIVLDNPDKLNAWSWESARQVTEIAEALRFDDAIRVVAIRAEGRAFCAGVDLGMPEDRITGRSPAEKTRNYYERFRWINERFARLSDLPQPVLVALHGYCLGAGLEIAMMGDIRIAADDLRIGLPEARVGVGIDAGADLRLITEIGAGWTKLMAFTGRRLDAETALRLNLVQQVVAKDALLETVRGLASEIAANAPLAVQTIKRTINFRAQQGLHEATRFESASAAPLFTSDDMTEGYRATAAKERPKFTGK